MGQRILLFCFFLVQTSLCLAEKPLLLLHFDLNKTIVAFDTALGRSREDVIIHCLADTYTGKWTAEVEKPIPYSEYIKNYLLPGSTADVELKKARDEKISAFLQFLEEFDPSLYQKARQEFDRALDALHAQSTIVLSSFYSLVEYLKSNGYEFSIIIRTFGTDYVQVCPEIEKIAHIHFSKRGEFKEAVFFVDGDGSKATPKEFYSFLRQNRHVVVHDDWLYWAKHGEKQQFGKPFPFDLGDKATIPLFFDDNITAEEHSEKNIVNPIDANAGKSLEVYPLIQNHRIFPVDTIKAIEDSAYYIGLVKQALAGT